MKKTTPHNLVYTEDEDYPDEARQIQALADSIDTALTTDVQAVQIVSDPTAWGATLTAGTVPANFMNAVTPDAAEYDLGGGILLNSNGYPAIVHSGWYAIGGYADFQPSGAITANSMYKMEIQLNNASVFPPALGFYRGIDYLPTAALGGGGGAQINFEQCVEIIQGSFLVPYFYHTNAGSSTSVTGRLWLEYIGPRTVA